MKTVSAPVQNFVQDGDQLVNWLGLFWTQVFENAALVKSLEGGQALLAAQLYLNFVESLALTDRNNVPVFHRERWRPLVIKRAERDQGDAAALRVDMDPPVTIGPQVSDQYIQGTILKIGGSVALASAVQYPVAGIEDVMTCLVDNPVVPHTVLVRGVDFTVQNNTVLILRQKDPFDSGKFPVAHLAEDDEVVLWAADALVDQQFCYENLGYCLGIRAASSEFYRTLVNGLWDLYNQGTPLAWLYSGIGALVGEPTVVHPDETIKAIIQQADATLVATDREVYRVSPTATLRAGLQVGSVLQTGEFLTQTVRIYDTLDPMKMAACSEYGEQLRVDTFSLSFEPAMFRADLVHGLGATWEMSDIVWRGVDANGNPKLNFTLSGYQQDVDAFWADFWAYCERTGLSSGTCFAPYLYDTVKNVEGAVWGKVAPLEYFMRYFLQYSAFVIVVERAHLTSPPEHVDPVGLLRLMRPVVPAHCLMFVVEYREPDAEQYDLSGTGETLVPLVAKIAEDSAVPGSRSSLRMTYRDRAPIVRMLAECDA